MGGITKSLWELINSAFGTSPVVTPADADVLPLCTRPGTPFTTRLSGITWANAKTAIFEGMPTAPILVANLGPGWNKYQLGFGLFRIVYDLTDTQVKNIPTTPFPIIPAPGAGKFTWPWYLQVTTDLTVGYGIDPGGFWQFQWTDDTGPGFLADFSSGTEINNLLNQVGGTWGVLTRPVGTSAAVTLSTIENQPFVSVFFNPAFPGGALTGGDAANTVRITVDYSEINIP